MKEIETYTAKKNGTIMLNANELYCNITDEIQQEFVEALSKLSFNRYPDETNAQLIQAYANVMNLESTQILAGNGSDEMLGLLIGTFLGKGKRLYTLAPDFSMYDYYASMYEADIEKYACDEDGGFDIYEFIEHGRECNVDMILFSNPNNPTGHTLCNLELEKITAAFPSIPVIIDEAYAEFSEETMLDMLDIYPNLYVTRTLSKAYGLAGARLGFLISNTHNIAKLRPNVVPYNISSITQCIGTIVLSHADAYHDIITQVKKERDALYERVKAFNRITFYPSGANYLYGRSEQKTALLQALEEKGIIIRTYQDDTFRITISSPEDNEQVYQILHNVDKEACSV